MLSLLLEPKQPNESFEDRKILVRLNAMLWKEMVRMARARCVARVRVFAAVQ